jgi:hypothetical protein
VRKHRKMIYSKAVPIANVIYNASARSVTVNLARPSKGSVQLTVGAGIANVDGIASRSAFTAIVK